MPMVKTRFLRPCGVSTPAATSGAVRVESEVSTGGVGSWVLHNSFRWPALAGESVVSAVFQPLRCWS